MELNNLILAGHHHLKIGLGMLTKILIALNQEVDHHSHSLSTRMEGPKLWLQEYLIDLQVEQTWMKVLPTAIPTL